MKEARSPAPCHKKWAASSWLTGGHCSWTRWATSHSTCNPNCSGPCRRNPSSGWAEPAPFPIDVRLVAATNRNLTQMMGDKLFRSDLYYRLKVFPITMPPLRDHPGGHTYTCPTLHPESMPSKWASRSIRSRLKRCGRWSVGPGPEMYGNSRTSSNGRSSFPAAPSSVLPWPKSAQMLRKLR